MSKPTDPVAWATATNYTDPPNSWDGTVTKLEPPDRAQGFKPKTRPPAQWFNRLFAAAGNWLGYFDGRFDANGGVILAQDYAAAIGAGGAGLGSADIIVVAELPAARPIGGAASPHWEWIADSGHYDWRTLVNSGELVIPITRILNQCATDGATDNGTVQIKSVSVFMTPGAARTGTDRPLVTLQSQTITGGAPSSLAIHASQNGTASSTTPETVTATPGSPVTVTHLREYFLVVNGGNDAGTSKDKVHRALINYTRTRLPL